MPCTAAFSADPDGTPRLPFDARTGEILPEVWQRWLHWDPIRMIDRYADEVRSLRAVWIDAGTRDEWFLDLGAEAFRAGLLRVGVPEEKIAFELFPAKRRARFECTCTVDGKVVLEGEAMLMVPSRAPKAA